MTAPRPEIRSWLAERGYEPGEIDKILESLDAFDQRVNRESLFEDLASGDFDIGPIIQAALAKPADEDR